MRNLPPLDKIADFNIGVKKARRDAVTLSRLSRRYDATDESIALFNKIEDARQITTEATVNAIFDAGREYCVTHAQELLDILR